MKQNVAKTSIFVTIILFIGFGISFFREVLIAKFFGVSADVDAYTAAITIPINLFSIITLSIQSIVVPIYSKIIYNSDCKVGARYINSLINILIVGSIFLIVLFELLASPIAYVFTPGLTGDAHDLTVSLLRITLPTIVFSLVNYVYTGVLNVQKSFVLPAFSVWFLNLAVIFSILALNASLGITAACIGQIVGVVLQFLVLAIASRKYVRYNIDFDYKSPEMIDTYHKVLPVVWSTCIAELNAIVNRVVASLLFVGAIAALNYSYKINSVLLTFFTSAIATVVYPLYAEAGAKNDISLLNKRINLTVSAYAYFLIPLTLAILCLRTELIEVAFARGAFDDKAVDITQQLLACYVLGVFFIAIRETITKVYYSLEDTKTPASNATIGLLINVVLSITIPFVIGVNGLALASSITAAFIAIRLIKILQKKYKEITLHDVWNNVARCILPSIILSVYLLIIHTILRDHPLEALISGGLGGILLYCTSSALFKVPIALTLFKMIVHRHPKNKE